MMIKISALRNTLGFMGLIALTMTMIACESQERTSAGQSEKEDRRLQAGNLRIGDMLPDFELPTWEGDSLRLHDLIDGENYVGVLWHSPACPCAANCMDAVRKELSGPEFDDLKLVGVLSDDDMDQSWYKTDLEKQIKDGVVTFPLVVDEDREVMNRYGAKRTPTVWLADLDGNVQFWGAPENSLYPDSSDHRVLLKEALLALREGKTPDVVTEPPIGCLITVPKDEKAGSALTSENPKDS